MENIVELIEKGKIKRYFSVRHKPSFEGAIHHITQHATGAEPLFVEKSDYLYMLSLIKQTCASFKLGILSFVLMLNHIHLLIKLYNANLPLAMKELFERYAKHFNKKYGRKGHVFCGAYRSALCFDESYLLAASLYIHLNPVRKGLVPNPADYPWSSARLFLDNIDRDTFVDYKFVLSILNDDIFKAHLDYRGLLEKVNVGKIDNVLEQPKAIEGIADFLKKEKPDFHNYKGGKYMENTNLLIDSNLEEIIEKLENKDRLRKPHDIEARRFLIGQLKARGVGIMEIAEMLNLTRQSIYNALK